MSERPVNPELSGDGGSGGGLPPGGSRQRTLLVVGCVVAVLVGLVAFLVIQDDDSLDMSSTTSTAAPATTTIVAATTTGGGTPGPSTTRPATTQTAAPPVDASTAVWPTASGPVYATPAAAARGFAVDFVGFREPLVGRFKQGDARSGEVDVRAKENGPATTVLVRQLGSAGRWFVLGSMTANIQPSEPDPLAEVTSPLRVRGTSTAFEANVSVEVREDGRRESIGTGFVMGGANGQMGPFDGTVDFEPPTADAGAIVFLTHSAEDGRVWEASTVRVTF